MIQYIIIAIVVALSVAYVVNRVRKTAESAGDPCFGCEGCSQRKQMSRKKAENGEKHVCFTPKKADCCKN